MGHLSFQATNRQDAIELIECPRPKDGPSVEVRVLCVRVVAQ